MLTACRYNSRRQGSGSDRAVGKGGTIEDREQELEQLAERFAGSMSQQFGETFDFSPASLTRLDAAIDQWLAFSEAYRGDDPNEVLSMALPLAAYVGEVIRRTRTDAVWITVEEAGQIAPPHIKLANGARVNVLKKAIQTLTQADSPSFAEYFRTVVDLAAAGSAEDLGTDESGA